MLPNFHFLYFWERLSSFSVFTSVLASAQFKKQCWWVSHECFFGTLKLWWWTVCLNFRISNDESSLAAEKLILIFSANNWALTPSCSTLLRLAIGCLYLMQLKCAFKRFFSVSWTLLNRKGNVHKLCENIITWFHRITHCYDFFTFISCLQTILDVL